MNRKPDTDTEAFDHLRRLTDLEGTHASAVQRLINETPQFRPEAAPADLVAEFANGKNRMPAFLALYTRGCSGSTRHGAASASWLKIACN